MTIHRTTIAPGVVRSYDDGRDRKISNSEIGAFKWCRRNWWLTYYRRLGPIRDDPTSAAGLGTLVHIGLQTYYEAGAETAMAVVSKRAADDVVMFEDTPDRLAAVQKTHELARVMLEGYFEWAEETGADEDLRVVGVEEKVEVPLAGLPGVSLLAKMDTRVERVSTGERVFVDHKTVQSIGDTERLAYLQPQFRHYHLIEHLKWIADGRPPGSRTGGVIINMLRKVKRTATAKPPFYGRMEIRHNDEILRRHWEHIITEILEVLDTERALDEGGEHHKLVPPTAGRDCLWRCPFVSLCPMFDDGGDAESMIQLSFAERDPLARYHEDGDE